MGLIIIAHIIPRKEQKAIIDDMIIIILSLGYLVRKYRHVYAIELLKTTAIALTTPTTVVSFKGCATSTE